jgi:hypothetical protein
MLAMKVAMAFSYFSTSALQRARSASSSSISDVRRFSSSYTTHTHTHTHTVRRGRQGPVTMFTTNLIALLGTRLLLVADGDLATELGVLVGTRGLERGQDVGQALRHLERRSAHRLAQCLSHGLVDACTRYRNSSND